MIDRHRTDICAAADGGHDGGAPQRRVDARMADWPGMIRVPVWDAHELWRWEREHLEAPQDKGAGQPEQDAQRKTGEDGGAAHAALASGRGEASAAVTTDSSLRNADSVMPLVPAFQREGVDCATPALSQTFAIVRPTLLARSVRPSIIADCSMDDDYMQDC